MHDRNKQKSEGKRGKKRKVKEKRREEDAQRSYGKFKDLLMLFKDK